MSAIAKFHGLNYRKNVVSPITPGVVFFRAGNRESFGTLNTGQSKNVDIDLFPPDNYASPLNPYVDMPDGHIPPSTTFKYTDPSYPSSIPFGFGITMKATFDPTPNLDVEFNLSMRVRRFVPLPIQSSSGFLATIPIIMSGPISEANYAQAGSSSTIMVLGHEYRVVDINLDNPIYGITNHGAPLTNVIFTYEVHFYAE